MSARRFIVLVIVVLSGIVFSYSTRIPLTAGFAPGLLTALWFVRKGGMSWPDVKSAMLHGVVKTRDVLFILALVGLLLPSWTASGVINYLIEQGLSFISSRYFLVCAFWLTALVSFLLGTSSGSLSTVGLAVAGIGSCLEIPAPVVAGALVSGAFVGDRTSPLSSASRLVASSAGISMNDQMRAIMPTTVFALTFASLFFYCLDLTGNWHQAGITQGAVFSGLYVKSPFLFMPPAVLIIGIIMRLPAKPVFLSAIGTAIILGSLLQQVGLKQWAIYLFNGIHDTRTSVSGIVHMLPLMSFIAVTGAFNGLLDKSRMLESYLNKVLAKQPGLLMDSLRVGGLGLSLNSILCNQTLPIMISAGTLADVWSRRYPRVELARIVSDSGLIFAGLVPWNLLALLCGSILGISPLEYLPYAVFLWSLPLCTFAVSYWKMRKQVHLLEDQLS